MTIKEGVKRASKREGFLRSDHTFFFKQIDRTIDTLLDEFHQLMRSWTAFHLLFLFLIVTEITLFFGLFHALSESALLASLLGLTLFTLFSFFTFRLYYLSKRPEQLKKIQGKYLRACKQLLSYKEDLPQHNITVANACNKFASRVKARRYRLPFPTLSMKLQELSDKWHGDDVLSLKELLLNAAIDEHLKLVKSEPTSLEAHTALANAYVILSSLYDPKTQEEKFNQTVKRAVEEFKVLNDFAPDDPWIHSQLAYSYNDLKMPDEEILEYETIIKLCPWDKDTLFKLGTLYFTHGRTADGLRIYEKLRRSQYKRANLLLDYY